MTFPVQIYAWGDRPTVSWDSRTDRKPENIVGFDPPRNHRVLSIDDPGWPAHHFGGADAHPHVNDRTTLTFHEVPVQDEWACYQAGLKWAYAGWPSGAFQYRTANQGELHRVPGDMRRLQGIRVSEAFPLTFAAGEEARAVREFRTRLIDGLLEYGRAAFRHWYEKGNIAIREKPVGTEQRIEAANARRHRTRDAAGRALQRIATALAEAEEHLTLEFIEVDTWPAALDKAAEYVSGTFAVDWFLGGWFDPRLNPMQYRLQQERITAVNANLAQFRHGDASEMDPGRLKPFFKHFPDLAR